MRNEFIRRQCDEVFVCDVARYDVGLEVCIYTIERLTSIFDFNL